MVARRRHFSQSSAAALNDVRADYQAARATRYRRRRQGISLNGSGADYHYRSEADYLRLIEEARDMDRNDTIVGQTVDRAMTNETNGGFQVCPKTDDKAIDSDLWERWQEWCEDADACDTQGESDFLQMEEFACRATKVDGDIFALPSEEGQLQLVEGHRCRTPSGTKRNVIHGVLLDEMRRRLQYWFTKDDISPIAPLRKVSAVEAYDARDEEGNRQVFQILNPKRVSQTRGVTAFAPIFDALGMFEDINFAKMLQQQIVSCFAIFREWTDTGKTGLPSVPLGDRASEARSDGSTQVIEGIQPGMIIDGQPGQKLSGFSPQVPNESFFQHVKLILTLIGINLGMPLVLVLLDSSETNFSGWRGAIDQARLGFRRNQRAMIRRFHRPVWNWKVRQWIAEDPALRSAAERLGSKIFKHRWNPPRWPYIEPLTDRQADLIEITGNLNSRRRWCEEKQLEWETLSDEIVEDNAYAIRRAKKEAMLINREFKEDADPVHWRDLIALPLPSGMNVSFDGKNSNDRGTGQKRPQRNGEAA